MCSFFELKNFQEYNAKSPIENAATPYILAKPMVSGLALIKSGILSAAKNKNKIITLKIDSSLKIQDNAKKTLFEAIIPVTISRKK